MKNLIYGVFVFGFIMLVNGCQSPQTTKNTDQAFAATDTVVLSNVSWDIPVKGMTCEGCEKTIEAGVGQLNGIATVKANHAKGTAVVTGDSTLVSLSDIKQKINDIGYVAK